MRIRTSIAAVALAAVALPLSDAMAARTPAHAAAPRESADVYVKGGTFESVLPPAPNVKQVTVQSFRIDRTPITNGEFARFVDEHPQWRRDRVARAFADEKYLAHWKSETEPGAAVLDKPLVGVSWFAASAYCEVRGARLPRWYEWEYVAAASETAPDARRDDAWRQKILGWYARAATGDLPDVGRGAPNFYGVKDLHGLIWEWVDDAGSMMVSADNRQQGDPDSLRFCGSGALTMEQKENYAMLMRIAMLSSMQARYTATTMGFRCASDAGKEAP
jgi:formylglycine-generating enzyme